MIVFLLMFVLLNFSLQAMDQEERVDANFKKVVQNFKSEDLGPDWKVACSGVVCQFVDYIQNQEMSAQSITQSERPVRRSAQIAVAKIHQIHCDDDEVLNNPQSITKYLNKKNKNKKHVERKITKKKPFKSRRIKTSDFAKKTHNDNKKYGNTFKKYRRITYKPGEYPHEVGTVQRFRQTARGEQYSVLYF